MLELMQILSLLCGLDYSGKAYNSCLEQSRKCVEKNIKKISTKNKSIKNKKREIFYRCYKAGEIK